MFSKKFKPGDVVVDRMGLLKSIVISVEDFYNKQSCRNLNWDYVNKDTLYVFTVNITSKGEVERCSWHESDLVLAE